MAFGNFFKKKEEDFSDIDFSKKPGELAHMGLPADGDITNTGSNTNNPYGSSVGSNSSPYGEPQPSYGPSNPEAFQKLGNLNMQEAAEQYTQQGNSRPVINQLAVSGTGDSSDKLKMLDKDMQVINAKLDMLRSLMESINQRILNIEKLADDSKKEEKIRW